MTYFPEQHPSEQVRLIDDIESLIKANAQIVGITEGEQGLSVNVTGELEKEILGRHELSGVIHVSKLVDIDSYILLLLLRSTDGEKEDHAYFLSPTDSYEINPDFSSMEWQDYSTLRFWLAHAHNWDGTYTDSSLF